MNLGIFSGHIGRDANLGSHNGDPVTNFPLAVNVGTTQNKDTQWIDCAIWGKRAEVLTQYLLTGTKVTVVGRQKVDTYQKKDGSTGYKIVLNVIEVDLHGSRAAADSPPAAPSAARPAPRSLADLDDDIPF
jgi:single-strand DNA-binding protein